MTSTVTIALKTTDTTFPAGTPAPGVTRVDILDAATGVVLFTQDTNYTFPGVADGNYVARAQLLDTSRNPLGNEYQEPFTVATAPTDVILAVPSGFTITITPE